MVRIRPERFPQETAKKLHVKSVVPFKIVKRINDNAYGVDLPAEFDINPFFNIKDLVAYEDLECNLPNPLQFEPCVTPTCENPSLPPLSNVSKIPIAEKVGKILSDDIISAKDDHHRKNSLYRQFRRLHRRFCAKPAAYRRFVNRRKNWRRKNFTGGFYRRPKFPAGFLRCRPPVNCPLCTGGMTVLTPPVNVPTAHRRSVHRY
ncbi:hypothetical protein KFK09_008906 [Dendrobium nobile]|uniref:Tf2-1-like SH3-like domain-containing protein n=1 Tax=Dendrobium nobile TaxID=94219 RepID=A0A8T3BLE2_DENNO|nr:hypothetical protein KFK09_008906 [Dendrobium nobile]